MLSIHCSSETGALAYRDSIAAAFVDMLVSRRLSGVAKSLSRPTLYGLVPTAEGPQTASICIWSTIHPVLARRASRGLSPRSGIFSLYWAAPSQPSRTLLFPVLLGGGLQIVARVVSCQVDTTTSPHMNNDASPNPRQAHERCRKLLLPTHSNGKASCGVAANNIFQADRPFSFNFVSDQLRQ